ncbi:RD19B, partial [Symbiodinium microadriaticum]
ALGSCWAVSTAEAVEGQVAVTTGKLVPLSPEQLVECDASTDSSCGGGKGCADCGMFGGWPYLAYQYLEKAGGMFSEADWPYWATGMYPCMPQGYSKPLCGNHDDLFCKANSTKGQGPLHLCHASHGFAVRVTGWRALSRNETELAMQMVQYGPLSVLIEA